ncbi:MAG TPA: tRNA lysidine(34) synthetase TilS [Candidatus Marinimicrobia bacterium]|jgi:tRNA(Ile)-lysidine synthetase-like protein|nr:tRNA lysidine(34) synthetase TilS [Candidatus Neomarinimicrobiota bacterium]
MIRILKNKLINYCNELAIPLQELSILLSLSGGVDSMVLASLLLELRKEYGFDLALMHFNHNAHVKAEICEKFCRSFTINNNVKYYNRDLFINKRDNFESSSRGKRYTELNTIADKISSHLIFTAHHLDDQIETLYMKMLDNADWISKIGIREKLGKIRRPLLTVRKKEIKQIAIDKKISWMEDPTNNDLSFRRNLVRKSLLPRAIKLNKKLESQLLGESQNSKVKLNLYLSEFSKKCEDLILQNSKQIITVDINAIKKMDIEKLKIFIYWCSSNYFNIDIPIKTRNFWIELSNYLNDSKTGSIYILGPITLILNRGELLLISDYVHFLKEPEKIKLTQNKKWYNSIFTIVNSDNSVLSIDKNQCLLTEDLINDGLYLRRWKNGDKILSSNSTQHILLSNLFINKKISRIGKLMQPVVVNKLDDIVWVPGLAHAKLPDESSLYKRKLLEWIPAL